MTGKYGIQLSSGVESAMNGITRTEQVISKLKINYNTGFTEINTYPVYGGRVKVASKIKLNKAFPVKALHAINLLEGSEYSYYIIEPKPLFRFFAGCTSGNPVYAEVSPNTYEVDKNGNISNEDDSFIYVDIYISSWGKGSYDARGTISGELMLLLTAILPYNVPMPEWGMVLYNDAGEPVYCSGYDYVCVRGVLESYQLAISEKIWSLPVKSLPAELNYQVDKPLLPVLKICKWVGVGTEGLPEAVKYTSGFGVPVIFDNKSWGYRAYNFFQDIGMTGTVVAQTYSPEKCKIPYLFGRDYF